jgi:ubiquinone/menaquinone biosynthesis C-methylase UbiE
LDVGSGGGVLAGHLASEGADVVGIDPNAGAVERARVHWPDCVFDVGAAEALPYEDASFDLVVFANALHHVPLAAMGAALDEACRVLRPSGFLMVIEPLAQGSGFEALRTVEDETVPRLAAHKALKRQASNGRLTPVRAVTYVERAVYRDAEVILDRMIAVDPSREALVRSRRAEILATIEATAECSSAGDLILDYPMRMDILCKPGTL